MDQIAAAQLGIPAPRSTAFPAKSAKPDIRDYQALEPQVADLGNAAAVFEMVMDNLLGTSRAEDGVHTFELTHENWESLFFAMYQLTHLSRDLKRQYYSAFEPSAPTH